MVVRDDELARRRTNWLIATVSVYVAASLIANIMSIRAVSKLVDLTTRSFEAASYADVAAKVDADRVLRASTDDRDIHASEWESDDGSRLLMLEHFC